MAAGSFVCGISLVELSPNSLVKAKVLSSEDETYSQSIDVIISDTFQTAFVQLSDLLPKDLRHLVVSVPTHFTESDRKEIAEAASAAQSLPKFKIFSNFTVAHKTLRDIDHPERNELAIDIGLLGASSRLLVIEVDEGTYFSWAEKEVDLKDDINDAALFIELLVNPILEFLQEKPTTCDSKIERIVVVDSTFGRKSATIAAVVELLKSKSIFEPPVEVLVRADIVSYTADLALDSYNDTLVQGPSLPLLIFNVTPLAIGIVKADGFVLTIIRRFNTIPSSKKAILTTSEDNQTTATIRVVAGQAPRVRNNFIMGEFILDNLAPHPRGVARIQVEIRVEDDRTLISADELGEDGHPAFQGASASMEIDATSGLGKDDIEAHLEHYQTLQYDEEAENAENVWAGEEAQGALPK